MNVTKFEIVMSVLTRVELDGVITSVSRRLVYYPACDLCAGKMTILQNERYHKTMLRFLCNDHDLVSRRLPCIGVDDAMINV